jgi:hypothetical protein
MQAMQEAMKPLWEKGYFTIREQVAAMAEVPQQFEPGTHWLYGFSSELAAGIIEEVCQKSIDDVFEELHKYQETEGTTYDEATTTTIITALDKILTFLKDDRLKHCSRYKLTPETMAGGNKGVEQLIIKRLATCNPEAIKNKCNEILTFIGLIAPAQTPTPQTPTTESLLNDDNELILEKIGSGIKIMQVLGDSLNTAGDTGQTSNAVSTKKYLASVGITTVDQINFKELAKIFHEHPILRNEVATMVSLEGIRNIQYYVSRIIYRIKKTPTYTGITPEIGGGVNQQEDSALRTYWEKLVEKVKGEWIYFINLEDYKLDPFAALTLQEAIRTKNSSGENFSAKVTKVVSAASDTAMADKAGLIAIPTPYSTEKTPVVLQLRHGDNLSYIVCSLHNSTTAPVSKVYRYLGNIDLHKILSENMHQQTDFKTNIAKKYATSIYDADYDTKACSPFLNKYFKLDFSRRNKGTLSYTINGVYFGSNNFQRYSTVGEPQNQRTHCLSVYVESRLGTIPFSKLGPTPKPTIDNDIIVMANGAEVPDNRNLKDSATVALEVGQLFRFEDQSWAEAYFPNYTTQVLPGASTPPAITETDWNAVIKFRIYGVYITAKSHFIVTSEYEYQYELAYANSFINDVPYFHVSGVGTPVDQRVQEKSSKDKSIIVPDKYFPNVKRLFDIIREWQRSLSLTKQNANKTYSYEDFLMEISTTVPQTNPSTSINSSPKNPMPVEGFLNMNLHRMTEEQTFGNFNDYKEVLATVEMLLGNQAKNMKPIIKDMSIRNFLTLENNFKKASEVQRPLWFLKIKTVETNGEQIFTEVKFKRLIKHGSEIKIINKTTKTEIEVQISKIEYVKKKEGQF